MQGNHDQGMELREWSILLVLALLWGGSFFFFKILVADIPPFTVVLGRVGLAAIALNLVLLSRHDSLPREPLLWGRLLLLGILNNVIPFSAIAFGETRISSGVAAILNATTPVFTIIVAHFLTQDEKLRWGKIIGIVMGFCGVAVLIGPALFDGGAQRSLLGELACLLAALSYGFGGVYGRRFRGIPPLKIATGQLTASTAALLPLSLMVDRPWNLPFPSLAICGAFAGIAFLSTALAFILYFRLLATAGATNLSLVTFLLPITALLLGTIFLGETIRWYALAGLTLIGSGLAAIDGRPWRKVSLFLGSARAP
ncbi:DMT family transporter [Asaia prunellae]|uniref:DMT family transporter n=1 Tax=Asaia prunellae TaxID=610245 RepID=UPI00047108A8|nr:DMT family transporter [Asaia prunellae]